MWTKSGKTVSMRNRYKKNLIYHVYPIKGSLWQWNAEQISRYLNTFGGRRIVGIAIDEQTNKPEDVQAILGNCEYIIYKNNRTLGEVCTFMPAIEIIQNPNEDEVTFYAHTKGVTRKNIEETCSKLWASSMYTFCLSNLGAIECLLDQYSTVGCFKFGKEQRDWFYAGTFFWFKHAAIFTTDWWREIPQHYWGVEHYLGRHIDSRNACNLCRPEGHLYLDSQAFKKVTCSYVDLLPE